MANETGNLEPINLDGIEDVEILKAKIKEEREAREKEIEARRQLTARAHTAEEKLKEIKTSEPPKTEPPKKEESKPYNILDDEAAGLILDGYKTDEVRFIMANGGRKVLEDKDSYVTIAVNTKREQRKAEEAASQTDKASGGSDLFKQYTAEQLKKMKAADLEKILPKNY